MPVSILSSWLGPLLHEWVSASTVVTNLVHTFLLVTSLSLRFSFSVSLCRRLIPHNYEPKDFFAVPGLVLVPPSVVVWICRVAEKQSSPVPASIFAAYLFLLLGCTTTYHLSPFHPLARDPGPFLSRISKLSMDGVVIEGHAHQYYRRLHEKHGNIVRTGARSTRAYQ